MPICLEEIDVFPGTGVNSMHDRRGTPRVGFIIENMLGHAAHAKNLEASLGPSERAAVEFGLLGFAAERRLDTLPLLSNWTVRSGAAARRQVKRWEATGALDALFVHSQVPAVRLGREMRRIPTIVSIDATPQQIDELGEHYAHEPGPAPLEAVKRAASARCFSRAASIVAWSEWAAAGLVDEYGIDPAKIDVLHPGVVLDTWRRTTPRAPLGADANETVRVLFVGGDLPRKGGDLLIDAVRRLRDDADVRAAGVELELHLATTAELPSEPGIVVHNGLTPNSPELIALYHRCDVFAMPTLGDCLPMVLGEAAMSEMPLVSTNVGAIAEVVRDGQTGTIVTPAIDSIAAGLKPYVIDHELRRRSGEQARAHAERTLDAEANAERILDRMLEHAGRRRSSRVMLTVSGDIDPDIRAQIDAGDRPLADYVAIADRLDAELVDRPRVAREGSRLTSLFGRIHPDIAMAHHVFRARGEVDVVITDGEQIGYPLALLMRLGGRRGMRHLMVGHRLTAGKKVLMAKATGLHHMIDDYLLYASRQVDLVADAGLAPAEKLTLIDFMVDTEFFRPMGPRPARPRPLLVTAGREGRDYPTFIEAVRDLDVDVLIASASPWSKRDDNARDVDLPDHVTVTRLTQAELRDALNEAAFAVVPVVETDFQAGITTILEAMAVGRATVCTRTAGQTDVIEDGETGRYVPPADVAALRRVIEELLADPELADELGRNARVVAEERMDVRVYADVFAAAVDRQRRAAR